MKNSSTKMESNSSKSQKLKNGKNNKNIENKKFLNSKKFKEENIPQNKSNNNLNYKTIQKRLRTPKVNKKIKINNDKEKSIDLKELKSLCDKELKTLKNEEEKIQELRNKLRTQNDNNLKRISYTNKKINKIKNEENKISMSPEPHLKKNLIKMIGKSNKKSAKSLLIEKIKKNKLTSNPNNNVNINKPNVKDIKNKFKLNLNSLFPKNKIDFQAYTKEFKTKYQSPYKTLYSTRNGKAKILFDVESEELSNKKKNNYISPKKEQKLNIKNKETNTNKKNKKSEKIQKTSQIGILWKAGMEENNKKPKINQDTYFIHDLKNGCKFIGVCDGHGQNGKYVSEFIKNNMPKELENELNILISNEKKRLSILEGMLRHNDDDENEENKKKEKEKHNIDLDYEKIEELLKKVYISTNLKLFAENLNLNLKTSGSTCVTLLYKKNSPKKIYAANAGDSRVILIKSEENKDNPQWSYEQLSRDHTPSEPDEAERIIKYGGEIQKIENENGIVEGPLRIFKKNDEGPGLAMSRSFGDSEGQNLGIIAEPEVKEYSTNKNDKALVIASDGLWEYVSNEEVMNAVKNLWDKKDGNIIVNELYKISIEKWKKENCNIDDITIICVLLN